MISSSAFIAIAIAVFAVVALLVFLIRGKGRENRITPLAGLAFAFVVAGILFGEERSVGYGLMGVGILLAAADIVNRMRRR